MMKKLALLLLALTLAAPAAGQTVGASQLKRKTNGGTAADSANALYVSVYRGTSAPGSPLTGMLWCDTSYTPCMQKVYNGSTWDAQTAVTILTQDNLSAFPANPVDGQVSWVENQKRAIVYSSADQKWYYLDAQGREVATDYTDGEQYSSSFIPTPGATTGSVTTGGSVTLGAHSCAATCYNSVGGETMAGAAVSLTATTGNQTLVLGLPGCGTGGVGQNVYCSKANTTTPMFYVGTASGSLNVTTADSAWSGWTSPDKDFSAPLPSGFTMRNVTAGEDGCGSTGTSILCASRGIVNVGASTSAYGARLQYAIDGNPEDWSAKWHVVRWDKGFTGTAIPCLGTATAPGNYIPLASVFATNVNVPTQWVWAAQNATSTVHTIPFTTEPVTPTGSSWSRVAGAAPSAGTTTEYPVFYPPIQDDDFYVKVRGHFETPNWTYQLRAGVLEGEQDVWLYPGPADRSATYCENAFCGTTEMGYIAIFLGERLATTACSGVVLEFKTFSFTAE